MKQVIAIFRPYKLEEVREALAAVGVQGLTVSEINGFGRQHGHTEIYRGAEYTIDFVPKTKLEIALKDETLDLAVEAIRKAANTGRIGDGKIFVLGLAQATRIRTGDFGPEAL